jgi:hypothetical protein
MRHEDRIRRAAQEISSDIRIFRFKAENKEEDTDLPTIALIGSRLASGSQFELPLRPLSPFKSGLESDYFSETFRGQDVGISGIATPPSDIKIGDADRSGNSRRKSNSNSESEPSVAMVVGLMPVNLEQYSSRPELLGSTATDWFQSEGNSTGAHYTSCDTFKVHARY